MKRVKNERRNQTLTEEWKKGVEKVEKSEKEIQLNSKMKGKIKH